MRFQHSRGCWSAEQDRLMIRGHPAADGPFDAEVFPPPQWEAGSGHSPDQGRRPGVKWLPSGQRCAAANDPQVGGFTSLGHVSAPNADETEWTKPAGVWGSAGSGCPVGNAAQRRTTRR